MYVYMFFVYFVNCTAVVLCQDDREVTPMLISEIEDKNVG